MLNFNSLEKALTTKCLFTIQSNKYLYTNQRTQNLSISEIDQNFSKKPYMLYLEIFRQFFKHPYKIKNNLNNIINFIKIHISHTPPNDFGEFSVWIEVLSDYTSFCNIQIMNERNDLIDDMRNINKDAFADFNFKRNDIKQINISLRERRQIVEELRLKLQEFFDKYENELNQCKV